jgi:predicted N-acyltransferase
MAAMAQALPAMSPTVAFICSKASFTVREKGPMQGEGGDYVLQVHDNLDGIDGHAWNVLLRSQAQPTPFMRIEYLRALHDSGSATPLNGWSPLYLVVERGGTLVAACPAYAKSHSWGEYVFDWGWADAYRRNGLRYYPKLLCAVPFTPVPGTRLMATDAASRRLLADALRALAERSGWSSAHALFLDDADQQAFDRAGWLLREGVQFHWTRDEASPASDFGAWLATMQRDKRKKILQERRRVADAGVRFEVLEGPAIDEASWDLFHRCYTLTYEAHRSTPYLTRDFFRRMATTLPEHWLMFVARQDGEAMATSLLAIDRQRHLAWGRYWGATRHVPCLHFEACYYQPLQWCIDQGMRRFEGGAQGEHKMARGLLPVKTTSAHWMRDERFASAVGDLLDRESRGIAHYVRELDERTPFKGGS